MAAYVAWIFVARIDGRGDEVDCRRQFVRRVVDGGVGDLDDRRGCDGQ